MMHISLPASPGNNTFSSLLEWIARYKLSIPGILHSLDDFLIIDRDTVTCSTKLCRSWKLGTI